MKCLDCGKEFGSQKGLHIHVGKHGGLENYYYRHFPRTDVYTGKPIKFENVDQYFGSFFASPQSRVAFFQNSQDHVVKDLILKEWGNHKYTKLDFFPSMTYWQLANIYPMATLERIFGSLENFSKEVGSKNTWSYSFPLFETGECEILIDTREQNPFLFKGSVKQKLSIGDYMAIGKRFSKTAIDRKNPKDFVSSFSIHIERIRKNLRMAEDLGYNLIYVIENRPNDIEEGLRAKIKKTYFPTAISNARTLLREKKNFQIVFCDSRSQAERLTQCVLYNGKKILNVDIQYILDHGLGQGSSGL